MHVYTVCLSVLCINNFLVNKRYVFFKTVYILSNDAILPL